MDLIGLFQFAESLVILRQIMPSGSEGVWLHVLEAIGLAVSLWLFGVS